MGAEGNPGSNGHSGELTSHYGILSTVSLYRELGVLSPDLQLSALWSWVKSVSVEVTIY